MTTDTQATQPEKRGASADADRATRESSQSSLSRPEASVPCAVELADLAWRDAGFDIASKWEAENMIFAGEVVEGELRQPGVARNPRVRANAIVQKAIRQMRANSRWWDGLGRHEKRDLRLALERVTASAIEARQGEDSLEASSRSDESAAAKPDAQTGGGGSR